MATILLVDDEVDLHDVYKFYLAQMNLSIVSAFDGRQALECLESHPGIQMIVSDISMPGFSGIELLQKIRDMKLVTPIAFVTGYSTKENCVSALRLGAFDIVEKPIEKERILSVVKEGIALSKSAQNLQKESNRSVAHAKILAENAQDGSQDSDSALVQCRIAARKCVKLGMVVMSNEFARAKVTLICRSLQLLVENYKEMNLTDHLKLSESLLRSFSSMRMQANCLNAVSQDQVSSVLKDFESLIAQDVDVSMDIPTQRRVLDFERDINKYLKQCA